MPAPGGLGEEEPATESLDEQLSEEQPLPLGGLFEDEYDVVNLEDELGELLDDDVLEGVATFASGAGGGGSAEAVGESGRPSYPEEL